MHKLKSAFAIAVCTVLAASGAYASDISGWAEKSFYTLNSGGILNSDIIAANFKGDITRGEFCRLVTNIYETENTVTLSGSDYGIFSDSDDESVLKAYKLGVVKGKGDKSFRPGDSITRQEMAVMLSRLLEKMSPEYSKFTNQISDYNTKYSDSAATDEWAVADMAVISHLGIINGDDKGCVSPKKTASREEAICMLERVYKEYVKSRTSYQLPYASYSSDFYAQTHIISLEWPENPNTASYRVIIKQDGCEPMVIIDSKNERSIKEVDTKMTAEKDLTVYIAAYLNNGKQVFSEPKTFKKSGNSGAVISAPLSGNVYLTSENEYNYSQLSDKEKKAFPDGHYFESEQEARANMGEVTVPVWKLNPDGTKTASKKVLTVNKNLIDDVWSIFTEIFNDPSQFPIKDVGGFSWRKTAGGSVSEHSYGTCIDINYNENYYVKPDGTPITGSCWKPGEDPYSIAEDSAVVKIFAKYGWEWGGNAWSDAYAKDYMHFTYLGR